MSCFLEQALINNLFCGKVTRHIADVSDSLVLGQNVLVQHSELQLLSLLLRVTASVKCLKMLTKPHLEIPHSFLPSFRPYHLESLLKWDRENGKKKGHEKKTKQWTPRQDVNAVTFGDYTGFTRSFYPNGSEGILLKH